MDSRLLEKEKKTYVSLYKKNSLPYSLILLAILAELVYVVTVLDVMAVSYLMGIIVILNIVILFGLFTCAMKVSVYQRSWALGSILLGIYMLLRMSVLVPVVIRPYAKLTTITAANLIGGLILITAGIISLQKTDRRQKLQDQIDRSNTTGMR